MARAFRTPDYVELFSQGPHLAAYSFEVGNPDLELERGTGADIFVRLNSASLELELAGFYNRIDNFVFPRNTGEISRLQLPIYQFASETAEMLGAEGHQYQKSSEIFSKNGLGKLEYRNYEFQS